MDESIRFFEDELLPVIVAEDQTILPPLEAAIGRYGTLVNVVAYEHDEIRRGVEKFKAARKELQAHASWTAIQEANRHGIFLVQFLWDHFRKERTSLFPTARERLPAADLQAIRKRFTH
jgi:hemerythrin-like domain-containing protein